MISLDNDYIVKRKSPLASVKIWRTVTFRLITKLAIQLIVQIYWTCIIPVVYVYEDYRWFSSSLGRITFIVLPSTIFTQLPAVYGVIFREFETRFPNSSTGKSTIILRTGRRHLFQTGCLVCNALSFVLYNTMVSRRASTRKNKRKKET